MKKPLALDLCCGNGGWTIGLLAAGWRVMGVDVDKWDRYPSEAFFQQADVRKLNLKSWMEDTGEQFDLVVASPPCQEFLYRSFPFKRYRELAANVPPDKSIWKACERIATECEAPLVLENVRGAQKYMGKAKAHYGSFYLWGDVPSILPIGSGKKEFQKAKYEMNSMQRKGDRKEFAAKAAMIPLELSRWIGTCFNPG